MGHRSSQRHEPKEASGDQALRARLREISAEKPGWGYRRAHARLLEEDWSLNRKRCQRIWRAEGLRVRPQAQAPPACGVDPSPPSA